MREDRETRDREIERDSRGEGRGEAKTSWTG